MERCSDLLPALEEPATAQRLPSNQLPPTWNSYLTPDCVPQTPSRCQRDTRRREKGPLGWESEEGAVQGHSGAGSGRGRFPLVGRLEGFPGRQHSREHRFHWAVEGEETVLGEESSLQPRARLS